MRPEYRAYTTKFDREVHSGAIEDVLGPLFHDQQVALDEAWNALQTGLLPWKVQAHLMAAESGGRIRQATTDDERRKTVVTLLIDQSGSMRGQKMLFAAAATDVVREHLLTLGLICEVLGFTTSHWRGGRSRERWKWRFRPSNPGRLNDLLHIIYQSADDRRASTGSHSFRQMLRPDLPKENIDGEAIQWAARRLSDINAPRKLLVVLSDGAPVDDSTLAENGDTYLGDHLRSVVEGIAVTGDISIAAMGIGYRTHDFYPRASFVNAPTELGTALIALLEGMILNRD
jgi:cobaltochelatase CobT